MLAFLYTIKTVLVVLFIALIVAAALRPGVLSLERELWVPRALATLIVYLGFGLVVTIGVLVIVPAIIVELIALAVPAVVALAVLIDELAQARPVRLTGQRNRGGAGGADRRTRTAGAHQARGDQASGREG